MLRISPAITATQAGHYYRSEFARGDYYTEDGSIVASGWAGSGADQLGLRGAVRPEDFAHLLAGHDPRGRTLVATTCENSVAVVALPVTPAVLSPADLLAA